ncbi:MAG TPA: hypothetical protein VGV15_19885, partial [Terriglobales bacterium]|nr:hypothetical protein [Terriglobales bacterium]
MNCAFIWILLSASMLLAQQQASIEITAEPHHHLQLENESVRVFAVAIPPREGTDLTRHDHNFLVVTFQDSEIAFWAEGEAGVLTYRFRANDIHFYFGGRARAMRNDTSSEYRNLTVEFLNPKVTTYGYQSNTRRWQYGGNTLLPPVDPSAKFANRMPLGDAVVKDVQLLPGDEFPKPKEGIAQLLIALSDLQLSSGKEKIQEEIGGVPWIPSERVEKLVNKGAQPARFVVV